MRNECCANAIVLDDTGGMVASWGIQKRGTVEYVSLTIFEAAIDGDAETPAVPAKSIVLYNVQQVEKLKEFCEQLLKKVKGEQDVSS
jgi:hypothetical protein